jgi:formylglycine-generating enzyme required for sulfatase activity
LLALAIMVVTSPTASRVPSPTPSSPSSRDVQRVPGAATKTPAKPLGPAAIAAQVKLWTGQGYVVDPAVPKTAGRWPAVLIRSADKVKFQRNPSGLYLPAGYKPSSELAEDGYPRTLQRDDGATFARIVGGTFLMGTLRAVDSGPDEPGKAAALVKLSSFYMQQTEVTNGLIEPFMNTLGPNVGEQWRKSYDTLKSPTKRGPGPDLARRYPASWISWRIAADYARETGARLPTEAQWEYAARSQGQPIVHVWGNGSVPSEQPANINFGSGTRAVGSYDQDMTAQGIRDMTGNVREWCRDVWKPIQSSSKPVLDPSFPPPSVAASDDLVMVVRGGSYLTGFELGRTTARDEPRKGGDVTDEIGFRTVIECPEVTLDPR